MIEWRDQGILLATRRHGENSLIIDVFTSHEGRHGGVVRGGTGRKMAPVLQPGAQLDVAWKARLEEHLGHFNAELIQSRAALVMGRATALAGMSAVLGLLAYALPEREPHPRLYEKTIALLDVMCQGEDWPQAYLHWEIAFLHDLGYGLDLTSCTVTGTTKDLIYVSPKSGAAVSRNGAGEWADRLLPRPDCMVSNTPASIPDICQGLKTTGYFMEKWMAAQIGGRGIPQARQRLIDRLRKSA